MIETKTQLDDLRDRIEKILKDEGYGSVRRDDDDDLVFKHEGGTFVIIFDADDPSFVRVVFPNFWSIDSPEEGEQARAVASEVTTQCKCARVFIKNESAWASAEFLVGSPAWVDAAYVNRAVSMVRTAFRLFGSKMQAS